MFGQVPNVEHVSAEEAITLAQGESILVDVREGWEWDLGHAPEAINLPMSQLEERHAELPMDATLLVVCHSGMRSMRATAFLRAEGIDAVNVVGGMVAWAAAGGALSANATDS